MKGLVLFVLLVVVFAKIDETDQEKKECGVGNAVRIGRAFTLKRNNSYCASEGDCGNGYIVHHPINCNRDWANEWEYYCTENIITGTISDKLVLAYYDNTIGFRSFNWNRFCSVEFEDNYVVHCNRGSLNTWEYFKFISYDNKTDVVCSGHKVVLYSVQSGKYCYTRQDDVGETMYCDYDNITDYYIINGINSRFCNKDKNSEIAYSYQEITPWAMPEVSTIYEESSGYILLPSLLILLALI